MHLPTSAPAYHELRHLVVGGQSEERVQVARVVQRSAVEKTEHPLDVRRRVAVDREHAAGRRLQQRVETAGLEAEDESGDLQREVASISRTAALQV